MVTAMGAPTRLAATTALLAACNVGCSVINAYEDPPLVGEWEAPEPLVAGDSSTTNSMDVDLDGGGKGTLFYVDSTNTVYSDKSKLTWEQTDEFEYLIKFKCSSSTMLGGSCSDHTFWMECEADEDGEELECRCEEPNECPYVADTKWEWERA